MPFIILWKQVPNFWSVHGLSVRRARGKAIRKSLRQRRWNETKTWAEAGELLAEGMDERVSALFGNEASFRFSFYE